MHRARRLAENAMLVWHNTLAIQSIKIKFISATALNKFREVAVADGLHTNRFLVLFAENLNLIDERSPHAKMRSVLYDCRT